MYCHIDNLKKAKNHILKEIDIKNSTCYYFDDIININDLGLDYILLDKIHINYLGLDYILLDKRSYEYFDLSHCIWKYIRCKIMLIIFAKVDGYIKKYDRTKYVLLFPSSEKYKAMFDRIRYFITLGSKISDVYTYKYMKTKLILIMILSLEKRIRYA